MSNDELIEQYFSNRLSREERLEFDTLYSKDKTFKDEVDFLENLKAVSKEVDSQNFKTQLEGFEKAYQNATKTTKHIAWLKPMLAVAAVLVIALSINLVLNPSIDENKLFDTYFEPSKNVTQPIVRSDSDENILNTAFIAYNDSNYEEAVSLFKNAYQDSKQSELLFYEGNAFLALGDTKNAIEKFKEHLTYSDILTYRSSWYLALAYVKTKQLEKAKQALKTFINSGENFKKEEATSLLKKLE